MANIDYRPGRAFFLHLSQEVASTVCIDDDGTDGRYKYAVILLSRPLAFDKVMVCPVSLHNGKVVISQKDTRYIPADRTPLAIHPSSPYSGSRIVLKLKDNQVFDRDSYVKFDRIFEVDFLALRTYFSGSLQLELDDASFSILEECIQTLCPLTTQINHGTNYGSPLCAAGIQEDGMRLQIHPQYLQREVDRERAQYQQDLRQQQERGFGLSFKTWDRDKSENSGSYNDSNVHSANPSTGEAYRIRKQMIETSRLLLQKWIEETIVMTTRAREKRLKQRYDALIVVPGAIDLSTPTRSMTVHTPLLHQVVTSSRSRDANSSESFVIGCLVFTALAVWVIWKILWP